MSRNKTLKSPALYVTREAAPSRPVSPLLAGRRTNRRVMYSPALSNQMTQNFVENVKRYADNDIPMVHFERGQRKRRYCYHQLIVSWVEVFFLKGKAAGHAVLEIFTIWLEIKRVQSFPKVFFSGHFIKIFNLF